MEEEIDIDKIKKRLRNLNPNYIMIIAMVAIALIFFSVGQRVGYRQGYTYVDNWYEEYTERYCICSEMPIQQGQLVLPDNLTMPIVWE